jgi:hypothetical protein
MSKHVLPIMAKNGYGVIVNNASDWALVAAPRAMAYCATKGKEEGGGRREKGRREEEGGGGRGKREERAGKVKNGSGVIVYNASDWALAAAPRAMASATKGEGREEEEERRDGRRRTEEKGEVEEVWRGVRRERTDKYFRSRRTDDQVRCLGLC